MASDETLEKQGKPLTAGKIALAVCVGILLASSVIGVVYYASVEIPRQKKAQEQAESDAKSFSAELNRQNIEMAVENDRVEQHIRELEPGSPCNPLEGDAFTECHDLSTAKQKREYAAKLVPAHPRVSRVAAKREPVPVAVKALMRISKWDECEDGQRNPGISVATCEARMLPDAKPIFGCTAFHPRTSVYRKCQAEAPEQ